jgi:hypothetical protein
MSLIRVAGRAEQQLFPNEAFSRSRTDIFLPHCHVKATEITIQIVLDNDISVIIPTRDIYDTLVSLWDHLLNMGVLICPAFIPDDFKDMTMRQQAAFIIRLILPWYVNFYASWAIAEERYPLRMLWLPYEHTLADPTTALYECCRHIGVKRTPQQIKDAIAKAQQEQTRFNVGVPGRGRTEFTPEERADIDFTLMRHRNPTITKVIKRIWTPHQLATKNPSYDI